MYDDCFARLELRCGVLKEMLCKHGSCPFYKPKEQYEEEKIIYPNWNECTFNRKGEIKDGYTFHRQQI